MSKETRGMADPNCICAGNWRKIITASEPLFGEKYLDETGAEYIFCGVMYGGDDYYYCLWKEHDMQLLSCVGSIEQHGFKET